MSKFLTELPRPFYAFAIGTSEPVKQWGRENYTALATEIIKEGRGVLLLGGPNEADFAREIEEGVPENLRRGIASLTNATILESAAALSLARACVGNDTAAPNIAAACGRPAYVILGPRQLINHDPLIHLFIAPKLSDVLVETVLAHIQSDGVS